MSRSVCAAFIAAFPPISERVDVETVIHEISQHIELLAPKGMSQRARASVEIRSSLKTVKLIARIEHHAFAVCRSPPRCT